MGEPLLTYQMSAFFLLKSGGVLWGIQGAGTGPYWWFPDTLNCDVDGFMFCSCETLFLADPKGMGKKKQLLTAGTWVSS